MSGDDSERAAQAAQTLVDALYYALGTDRARAMYAQGTMLEGRFVPSPRARELCSARLFAHTSASVIARFSDLVCARGNASPACHRGLALKIQAPDEAELDIVAHSYDGFPCRTAEEFRELLVAMGLSRDSDSEHTPLDRFLATRPAAAKFLAAKDARHTPFAELRYFGVNAFRFRNTQGDQCHVRYRFIPRVTDQTSRPVASDLDARIARGPVLFDWTAQIAAPGDRLDDPSIVWPDSRRQEHLGSISLDRLVNARELDRKTLFLPGNLPDGIGRADPMLAVRDAAYPLSFRRRQ